METIIYEKIKGFFLIKRKFNLMIGESKSINIFKILFSNICFNFKSKLELN